MANRMMGWSTGHPLPIRGLKRLATAALVLALVAAGCAKYNTFYNANKAFNEAEQVREDRKKEGEDITEPTANQRTNYDRAIKKCQKILDEYPGSGMTDDALFLMAKSYHRLNAYRASIRNFDLLFANFPATSYEEESIYLQALNYLLIGDVANSNTYLERLNKSYPKSKFQAEALRVSGENSYTLENWGDARDSFQSYLEKYSKTEERDQIALMLAQSHWELEEYEAAADILNNLIENSQKRATVFEGRLLLARTLIKLGLFDQAERSIGDLKITAETYNAEGDVALIEAENLVTQGRDSEASPLLENLPEEWLTPKVAPRVNDMLGRIYFRRWDLDEARTKFTEAVKGIAILEEPEETRELLKMIRDYLAADQSLVDASGERVSTLKLLQANALLFGMQRPNLAASHYLEVAFDTDADSSTAARGLYGAYIAYQDYLAQPDSAALLANELERTYPESPQAFQLREGGQSDLLAYLLDLNQQQIAAQAAAQAEAEAAAQTLQQGAAAVSDSLTAEQLVGEGISNNAIPQTAWDDSLAALLPAPEASGTAPADTMPGGSETVPAETPQNDDGSTPSETQSELSPQDETGNESSGGNPTGGNR